MSLVCAVSLAESIAGLNGFGRDNLSVSLHNGVNVFLGHTRIM